jgi:hypothetical protein
METYLDEDGEVCCDHCSEPADECACCCVQCGDQVQECACEEGPTYPAVAAH